MIIEIKCPVCQWGDFRFFFDENKTVIKTEVDCHCEVSDAQFEILEAEAIKKMQGE